MMAQSPRCGPFQIEEEERKVLIFRVSVTWIDGNCQSGKGGRGEEMSNPREGRRLRLVHTPRDWHQREVFDLCLMVEIETNERENMDKKTEQQNLVFILNNTENMEVDRKIAKRKDVTRV